MPLGEKEWLTETQEKVLVSLQRGDSRAKQTKQMGIGKTGRMVVNWQLNGRKHAIPQQGSTSWSRMQKKPNKTKHGGWWTIKETGWQIIQEEVRGTKEEQKRKRSEQKLRRSGWVRYGEIDVLSLHLQPQKCQGCGELRWSESSSASLQPRLKYTYKV